MNKPVMEFFKFFKMFLVISINDFVRKLYLHTLEICWHFVKNKIGSSIKIEQYLMVDKAQQRWNIIHCKTIYLDNECCVICSLKEKLKSPELLLHFEWHNKEKWRNQRRTMANEQKAETKTKTKKKGRQKALVIEMWLSIYFIMQCNAV